MPYTLLDDQFCMHPKVMKLGTGRDALAAVGLQARAMSWCAGNPTDGHVPHSVDEMFAGKTAAPRYRAMLFAAELRVRCETHSDCSVIHDWLDPRYGNLSADEIKKRREADAARKRAARATASGKRPPDVQPDTDRTSEERPDGHAPDTDRTSDRTSRAGAGDRAGAGALPTPTPVVSSCSPPSSSVPREETQGEDLSDPAGRIRSRRRAAGLSLDGWDPDALHGLVARNADAFSGGMTENDLWRMLDVLAPLPETQSPGRVLNEHGQALARRLLAERRNTEAHRRQGENALADIEHRQQIANRDQGTHKDRLARLAELDETTREELLTRAYAELRMTRMGDTPNRAVVIRAIELLDAEPNTEEHAA